MASCHDVPVEASRAPTRIDLEARSLAVGDEEIPFDVLLSTLPLPRLLELCTPVPEAVRGAAERLRFTHLHYLDVAIGRENPLPYHWVYVPEQHYPFYRVGCYSHFSAKLAPPGCSSLYVELADRAPQTVDTALARAVPGLVELGFIESAAAIRFARLRTIDFAYVIYDHHYRAALDVIEPFLVEQRVVSAGRYGGWNYSSMEDALLFGRAAAERAHQLLSVQPR